MDQAKRRLNADKCLDQMTSALQDSSYIRLRDVIDPWFAFETGNDHQNGATFLTAGGRHHTFDIPCPWKHWRTLRHKHFWVTPDAEAILARGERKDPAVKKKPVSERTPDDDTVLLTVDHSVPLARLWKMMANDEKLWERTALREFLFHHYRRGVLIKNTEDARLNLGLNGKSLKADMPQGWERGGDPFARYKAIEPPLERVAYGRSS